MDRMVGIFRIMLDHIRPPCRGSLTNTDFFSKTDDDDLLENYDLDDNEFDLMTMAMMMGIMVIMMTMMMRALQCIVAGGGW